MSWAQGDKHKKGAGGRGWYFSVSGAQSVGRRCENSLRGRFICHENFFLYQWLKHFASLPSCFSRVLLFATSSHSSPGSSVHGILQTILLESVAMPSSGGPSWPKPTSPVIPALQMDSLPLSHWGSPLSTLGKWIHLSLCYYPGLQGLRSKGIIKWKDTYWPWSQLICTKHTLCDCQKCQLSPKLQSWWYRKARKMPVLRNKALYLVLFICVCTHACVCLFTCMCTCLYVHVGICINICVHAYMHLCLHTNRSVSLCMDINIHCISFP